MIITDDDKKLIRKLIEIKNRGYYCSSEVLKNLYNRVFETNWKGTTCSSCMRVKVSELEKALRQWEEQERKEAEIKAQETLKQEEPTPIKEEIKEEPTEPKKKGRKPKKKGD